MDELFFCSNYKKTAKYLRKNQEKLLGSKKAGEHGLNVQKIGEFANFLEYNNYTCGGDTSEFDQWCKDNAELILGMNAVVNDTSIRLEGEVGEVQIIMKHLKFISQKKKKASDAPPLYYMEGGKSKKRRQTKSKKSKRSKKAKKVKRKTSRRLKKSKK